MSYYGSGEWVVIKRGFDNKVAPFHLSEVESYDWDRYNTLKEKESEEIKWFNDEEQTVNFIFDNFDESMILKELVWKRKNIPSGYYFE